MCTVYGQGFCNILGFLKIKFIVGKKYGIMLQTQQKISRIMLKIHRKHQEKCYNVDIS